jgi:Type II/IV secretion system protein
VGQDSKTFLSALRAALRQDPDVILIGEMRGTETVRAALQAAETGHLVRSLKQASSPIRSATKAEPWLVPTVDLLPVAVLLARQQMEAVPAVPELRAELERVQVENPLLRERLASAEAIAAERQDRIDDLRLALRMLPEVWADRLTGKPSSPPALPAPAPVVEVAVESGVDPWAEVERLRQLLQAEHEEHERLLTQVGRFSLWPFRRRRRRRGDDLLA